MLEAGRHDQQYYPDYLQYASTTIVASEAASVPVLVLPLRTTASHHQSAKTPLLRNSLRIPWAGSTEGSVEPGGQVTNGESCIVLHVSTGFVYAYCTYESCSYMYATCMSPLGGSPIRSHSRGSELASRSMLQRLALNIPETMPATALGDQSHSARYLASTA